MAQDFRSPKAVTIGPVTGIAHRGCSSLVAGGVASSIDPRAISSLRPMLMMQRAKKPNRQCCFSTLEIRSGPVGDLLRGFWSCAARCLWRPRHNHGRAMRLEKGIDQPPEESVEISCLRRKDNIPLPPGSSWRYRIPDP